MLEKVKCANSRISPIQGWEVQVLTHTTPQYAWIYVLIVITAIRMGMFDDTRSISNTKGEKGK